MALTVVDKSRYTLLKGAFWVHYPDKPSQGPEPDGDTVRFAPDDVGLLEGLERFSGRPPDVNARGTIAVRYEGIDALETHFKGTHQDLRWANAARDANLRLLGFRDVVFSDASPNKIRSVSNHPARGFVLANGIEGNGRLLGLVHVGGDDAADGSRIFVDERTLGESVNAGLVRAGLAYAELYDTMPIALVQEMRRLVKEARRGRAGLFAAESVGRGASAAIEGPATLETLVMWPKLWRRLAAYFAGGRADLAGFEAWLRADPVNRDDTLRLPSGEKANMHDTFRVEQGRLELLLDPEDLLIAPDPAP